MKICKLMQKIKIKRCTFRIPRKEAKSAEGKGLHGCVALLNGMSVSTVVSANIDRRKKRESRELWAFRQDRRPWVLRNEAFGVGSIGGDRCLDRGGAVKIPKMHLRGLQEY